jgi:hypothetical protein
MNLILRNGVAVIVGLLVGGMFNMALVTLGPRVFPPPDGVNMADPKSLAASAHLLEPKHFIFPFLAHAAGTLVGAVAAHLIGAGPRSSLSYGIGVLFLAGGIAAASMIPAPGWFVAVDLVAAYLPMAWLATRLGLAVRPGAPAGATHQP